MAATQPPPPRSLTIARLRAICMALPAAVEKEAWGEPTWRAGTGKMFAQPADQTGALWLPSDHLEQALLIDSDPERFFIPPYVGVKGWVAVRLDNDTDWEQVATLLVGAYRRVASRKLLAAADAAKIDPAALARHALATAKADDDAEAAAAEREVIAAKALEHMRAICLAFPAAAEQSAGYHHGFRVEGKAFAYLTHNHHGDDMVAVQVKAAPGAQDVLISADPSRFFLPPFMAKNGWVGVRVDVDYVDWEEIGALLLDSYRLMAPKRLLKETILPGRA